MHETQRSKTKTLGPRLIRDRDVCLSVQDKTETLVKISDESSRCLWFELVSVGFQFLVFKSVFLNSVWHSVSVFQIIAI